MKKCSVCQKVKSYNEFYSQEKRNINGENYTYYRPDCKECAKEKATKRQIENREETIKYKREWYKQNRERQIELMKIWNANNLEFVRQYQSDWQKNNPDKLKVYRRNHRKHGIKKGEWVDCKKYFNNECAYCGLSLEEHFITFKGEVKLGDFHKEHVFHNGKNDLSNCVPSCKSCNVKKHTYSLEEWFCISESFNQERLDKIILWLTEDHKQYISK